MTQFILFNAVLFGLAVAVIAPWRLRVRCGLGCAVFGAGLAIASPLDPSPDDLLMSALFDSPAAEEGIALERRFRSFGVYESDDRKRLDYARLHIVLGRIDPIADAHADIEAGLIGFITIARASNNSSYRAPGIFCGQSEIEDGATVARHSLLHLTLIWRRHDHAVNNFYRYAMIYNRYVSANTYLRNEDCRPSR